MATNPSGTMPPYYGNRPNMCIRYDASSFAIFAERDGAHETTVNALTFSPKGKTLASGARDGSVRSNDAVQI